MENRINILPCAVKPCKMPCEIQNERLILMQSILEEFAYGTVTLQPRSFEPSSAYSEALRLVAKNEENLLGKLDGEEKLLLETLIDMQGEVNQLTAVRSLVRGYKLGVLMTAEAFVTGGDLVAG